MISVYIIIFLSVQLKSAITILILTSILYCIEITKIINNFNKLMDRLK